MDPVTVLSVFFQIAANLPSEQGFFKNKDNEKLSRTEIIEIYRKDMKNNSNSKKTKFLK